MRSVTAIGEVFLPRFRNVGQAETDWGSVLRSDGKVHITAAQVAQRRSGTEPTPLSAS
jgi:hypothetical protein